ncbi:TRAP transporter small permease subunit [Chloroflexota bacterium]
MKDLAATLESVDTFWRKLMRTFAIICGSVVIVTTLVVVADVSRRYLLNKPIVGVADGVAIVMPYIVFPALGYALATGTHVRVTLLFGRLPLKLRLWADSLTCILGLFFLGVLTYFGWVYFWHSFLVNETVMSQVYLPMWVAKFSMPLGVLVFSIQYLLQLSRNIARLTNRIELSEEVTEQIMAG